MIQFNDWCDFADTPFGNHNIKVMTKSATGRTFIASSFKDPLAPPSRYLLIHIPPTPNKNKK